MNVKEQEKRLEDIFRKNNNEGFAVAITGCWGVGKTHFWKNFLEKQLSEERLHRNEKIFNRKYAYVSLFGIESLSDLKTQIYSNIKNNHSSIEVPKWLKGLPSIFKDTRISQLGISAPAKLIDTLMFSQVKDAIICFDDFERMSNKLDIQDVMGLANQLKLERRCQVILILDESKNDEENKKKYAEYKEKLIDETIKITSVEPLIRENSTGMDDRLIDLMVMFADELEIHNFRFFQKVIKLYKQFIDQLPNKVAYSTKKIILIRIMQGFFIDDFGRKLEISWDDLNFLKQPEVEFQKLNNEKFVAKEKIEIKKMNNISPIFSQNDLWEIEFRSWFEQKNDFNPKVFQDHISLDLLNEDYDKSKGKINELILKYKKYNIDSNFTINLACEIKKIIKFEVLENIEFYCSLLSEFEEQDEINQIEQLVQEHLQSEFQINREIMLKRYYWHEDKEQKYRKYIKDLLDDPNSFQLQEFLKILKLYIQKGEVAYGCEEVLSQMTQSHLKKFIRDEYPHAFKTLSLKITCEKIIELYEWKQANMVQTVKHWLKEIIEQIGKSKNYPQHYIDVFTEKL